VIQSHGLHPAPLGYKERTLPRKRRRDIAKRGV
jgi:hypothetical protein